MEKEIKMSQRNIFGYFQTMDQARKAAEKLKSLGFETISVDRFSPLLGGNPYDGGEEITGIFQNQRNSLTTTTLGSPAMNDDERILATVHPDASGLAGGRGFSHPEDVCVTIITDDDRYEEAYHLLERYGARV
jgi:hypothetical protein